MINVNMGFYPDRIEELELEPDAKARIISLHEQIEVFRNSGPLDEAAVKKLSEYFRIQHIFHSTGIEGNRLTLHETQVVVREGLELNDKPLADQLEVKDLDSAFSFLEECTQKNTPFREIDLREMHRMVVGHSSEARPGEYRSIGVMITGSELRPPEPLAIPGLMEVLVRWMTQEDGLDVLVRAAVIHHKFTAIHPFVDGNGRVARLLMNLVLLRGGYPIVNVRREERPRYYEALSYADLGLYSPLVTLMLDRGLEVFGEMKRIQDETIRARQWTAKWGQKETEVLRRRQEREYKLWLGQMENIRLEFENRADLISDSLKTVWVDFKSYPVPDLTKFLQLEEKGKASAATWFFSLDFRSSRPGEGHYFFFRFFRDHKQHSGSRAIPLQLNWFVDQEPKPVEEPKIRLREFVVDPKTRKLKVINFENGKKVTSGDLPVQQAVEQFFDDVLKNCFGIVV